MLTGITKPLPGATVDIKHGIARGMLGCWLLNEGFGRRSPNLGSAGDTFPILHTAIINPYSVGAFGGSCGYYSAGTNYGIIRGFPQMNEVAILLWVRSSSTGTQHLFNRDNFSGLARIWQYRISANKFEFIIFNAGGGAGVYVATSTTSVNDGRWHQLVGNWNTRSNQLQVWVDGRLDGSTSTVGTLKTSVERQIDLCQVGITTPAAVDHALIWNRYLLPEEIRLLYAQPFVFMSSRAAVSYFVPVPTFKAAWAVQRSRVIGGGVI